MNFSLYIFGTPKNYNQYPADTNELLFQEFSQKQLTDTQLTIFRSGQLAYYIYAHKLTPGTSNNYLGICLVFNGIYCQDTKQLFDLFDKAYFDIAVNGEILQINESGKTSFVIDKFANKPFEIERVKLFFQNNLRKQFAKDFAVFTSQLSKGASGSKTLSLNDDNSHIQAAILEYDCVHIANNKKSNSQLDRINKMLSDLQLEKQELYSQYLKLVGQKKQYKVVILLCFAVVGCILSLIIFNKNMQGKSIKIQSLEAEIAEKKDTILDQLSTIAQLHIGQAQLNDENKKLNQNIYNKNNIINENVIIIQNLNDTINQKSAVIVDKTTKIQNLNSDNASLRKYIKRLDNQNQQLYSQIENIKRENIQKYQVVKSQAFCYSKCASNYSRNECYYKAGAVLDVYTQQDGYGLTVGGYLKMNELRKY